MSTKDTIYKRPEIKTIMAEPMQVVCQSDSYYSNDDHWDTQSLDGFDE